VEVPEQFSICSFSALDVKNWPSKTSTSLR
jgi:hypothetical protein